MEKKHNMKDYFFNVASLGLNEAILLRQNTYYHAMTKRLFSVLVLSLTTKRNIRRNTVVAGIKLIISLNETNVRRFL